MNVLHISGQQLASVLQKRSFVGGRRCSNEILCLQFGYFV